MKTASVPGSSISSASLRVDVKAIPRSRGFRLSAWLNQLRCELAASLPAIGLAEGGDTAGAAELLARSGANKA